MHAHPDDESLWTGGTIARYASAGAHVTVVTCTLGEEGEIIPPALAHLAASGPALTIFRPTVVVGHRRTGWSTRKPFGYYMFVNASHRAARRGIPEFTFHIDPAHMPHLVAIDDVVNAAVALTQLFGSAFIIANRFTWLGAGMLAVFTALTIPIAHNFWTMEEPLRTLEFYVVMEHVTVIGALMVVAWKSAHTDRVAATA